MIEGSLIMYMMKFNQSIEDKKEDLDLTEINDISVVIYQQLLHAEIEYHSKKYPQAIKILADLIPHTDSLKKNKEFVRSIIDHNLAVVLAHINQTNSSRLLLKKSLNYFSGAKEL